MVGVGAGLMRVGAVKITSERRGEEGEGGDVGDEGGGVHGDAGCRTMMREVAR